MCESGMNAQWLDSFWQSCSPPSRIGGFDIYARNTASWDAMCKASVMSHAVPLTQRNLEKFTSELHRSNGPCVFAPERIARDVHVSKDRQQAHLFKVECASPSSSALSSPTPLDSLPRAQPRSTQRQHIRPRSILTKDQVNEIFQQKAVRIASRGSSTIVAQQYNISPKTVRDIWSGRTWFKETLHLDASREFTPERLTRRPGRPKGAKDSKPRQRKQTAHTISAFSEDSFRTTRHHAFAESAAPPPLAHAADEAHRRASYPAVGASHAHSSADTSPSDDDILRSHRPQAMPSFCAAAAVVAAAARCPPQAAVPDQEAAADPFHDDWPFWAAAAAAADVAWRT